MSLHKEIHFEDEIAERLGQQGGSIKTASPHSMIVRGRCFPRM